METKRRNDALPLLHLAEDVAGAMSDAMAAPAADAGAVDDSIDELLGSIIESEPALAGATVAAQVVTTTMRYEVRERRGKPSSLSDVRGRRTKPVLPDEVRERPTAPASPHVELRERQPKPFSPIEVRERRPAPATPHHLRNEREPDLSSPSEDYDRPHKPALPHKGGNLRDEMEMEDEDEGDANSDVEGMERSTDLQKDEFTYADADVKMDDVLAASNRRQNPDPEESECELKGLHDGDVVAEDGEMAQGHPPTSAGGSQSQSYSPDFSKVSTAIMAVVPPSKQETVNDSDHITTTVHVSRLTEEEKSGVFDALYAYETIHHDGVPPHGRPRMPTKIVVRQRADAVQLPEGRKRERLSRVDRKGRIQKSGRRGRGSVLNKLAAPIKKMLMSWGWMCGAMK
ncbi:hypothetical protein HK101_001336 [Irineochytrium annulatum]|nr:hypothetical protein HK101_001336 [Irineochytrium annulatum]